MPTDRARFLLNWHLTAEGFRCITVFGDPDPCKAFVADTIDKIGLEYCHFVEVPTMPSLEDIHRYQRENTIVREGTAERPTFIRSFLAANGFPQIPQVLILNGFNSIPSEQTYFLKGFLDEKLHEDDESYERLTAIILIAEPPNGHDAFEVDSDVAGCLRTIIDPED